MTHYHRKPCTLQKLQTQLALKHFISFVPQQFAEKKKVLLFYPFIVTFLNRMGRPFFIAAV